MAKIETRNWNEELKKALKKIHPNGLTKMDKTAADAYMVELKARGREVREAMKHKTITHITGAICSGKSYLLKDIPDKYKFDVASVHLEYYPDPTTIIHPSGLKELRKEIISDLRRRVAEVDVLFVESSGLNKAVNKLMEQWKKFGWDVIEYQLEKPTPNQLIERCQERGLDAYKVSRMNDAFNPGKHSQVEVYTAVVACLDKIP